jgi:hypothetical protein
MVPAGDAEPILAVDLQLGEHKRYSRDDNLNMETFYHSGLSWFYKSRSCVA